MNEVPDFRFRFGLRAMIIGLTVTGCVIGLLGKLMLSNFQMFALVVTSAATILPFILAIATLVKIGQRTGRRGLTLWAVLLLLTPLVGVGLVGILQMFADPSNTGKGIVSNRRLIQGELAKSPQDYSVWRELNRRVVNNKFSREEVGQIATELTKYMTSKRSGKSWDQPLSDSRDFFKEARKRDLVPEPELLALCDAYFGTDPRIRPLNAKTRVRSIQIEFGTNWQNEMHHGLGVAHMWQVQSIMVDGNPVELNPGNNSSGQNRHIRTKDALPADGKELTAEIEIAYIDSSKLIGLNGNVPVERWPKAIKRWTKTVTMPLDGSDPTKQIPQTFKMVTDPTRAPPAFQVERLAVQRDEGGFSLIVIKWKSFDKPSIPISYDVSLDIGGEEIGIGSIWIAPIDNGMTYSGDQLISRGHRLDPGLEAADVILRPNTDHLMKGLENSHDYDVSQLTEVWGLPNTISDVTMERLDLEDRTE